MDRGEEDAYLNEIASHLTHLAPGGWELARFNYRAVGTSFEEAYIGGGLVHSRELHKHNEATPARMNDAEALLPFSGIYPIVRELRSRMNEDGGRAWLEMNLQVHCRAGHTSLADGDTPLWEVRYKSVDEISWADEVTPAAAAEELRMFPQEPHRVPEWMTALASIQEPADRFDAEEFMRSPQPENELTAALPEGLDTLFPTARECLLDFVPPESAGRFLVGRLADGCWSVLHTPPAWLAVRMENGACVEKHAYADPAAAVAFTLGAVLAEAGTEVNSTILRGAGVLSQEIAPRKEISAWTLPSYDKNGSIQYHYSMAAERPRGAAARGRRYISLSPLHNRPGGYFVVQPGPVPAKGDFVSTHQIFEWYVEGMLPKARAPRRDSAEEEFPEVVLEPGMELDTHEGSYQGTLFTIGTPFERRQLWGYPEDYSYHVYRVLRPIHVKPITLKARTIYREGERGPKRLPEHKGQAFDLDRPIRDLLESGDLVEITEPGGTPLPLRDYWEDL